MCPNPPAPPSKAGRTADITSGNLDLMQLIGICRQATEAALSQMNNSVNWAMTLTLAISGFVIQVLSQSNNQPATSFIFMLLGIQIVGFAVLLNFFSRTAKSYINIIRFSLIEREALNLSLEEDSSNRKQLIATIRTFYSEWHTPLPIGRIIQKVFLEFGFIFWIVINISLTFYVVSKFPHVQAVAYIPALIIIWIFLGFLEWVIFGLSAYSKNHTLHSEATIKS